VCVTEGLSTYTEGLVNCLRRLSVLDIMLMQ